MTTTFRTSNKALLSRISNYLRNKKMECMESVDDTAVSIFNLEQEATELLIAKLAKHFRLKPLGTTAQVG